MKGRAMVTHVKARFCNGALVPLEPLDLEEGQEVRVSVEGASIEEKEGPLLRILRWVEERQAEIPPDTWDGLPTDFVKNKKHYLYGHLKEEE